MRAELRKLPPVLCLCFIELRIKQYGIHSLFVCAAEWILIPTSLLLAKSTYSWWKFSRNTPCSDIFLHFICSSDNIAFAHVLFLTLFCLCPSSDFFIRTANLVMGFLIIWPFNEFCVLTFVVAPLAFGFITSILGFIVSFNIAFRGSGHGSYFSDSHVPDWRAPTFTTCENTAVLARTATWKELIDLSKDGLPTYSPRISTFFSFPLLPSPPPPPLLRDTFPRSSREGGPWSDLGSI